MTEQEFLKQYNPNDYDLLSLSADNVIFSIDSQMNQDNYRKLDEQRLMVLLVKRTEHPHLNMWSLPGGFMRSNETSEQAAMRALNLKTGISDVYLEQLRTNDLPNRDPRMRIVSCSYLSLINRDVQLIKHENASWFEVKFSKEQKKLILKNETMDLSMDVSEAVHRNGKLKNIRYQVCNSTLAFDHASILLEGLMRLRNKVEYTDIVFNLLPNKFTITQLQRLYEIILDEKLLAPVFRRKIASKILETGEYSQEKGHRPSQYFTYKNNTEE